MGGRRVGRKEGRGDEWNREGLCGREESRKAWVGERGEGGRRESGRVVWEGGEWEGLGRGEREWVDPHKHIPHPVVRPSISVLTRSCSRGCRSHAQSGDICTTPPNALLPMAPFAWVR